MMKEGIRPDFLYACRTVHLVCINVTLLKAQIEENLLELTAAFVC